MPDTAFPANRKTSPKVLAFDTAGPHIAVGTTVEGHSGGAVIDMPRGQAEALFAQLEDHLKARGWAWSDLDAIGVGVGPGNFTGIRISVSAARGLGLALGIPVFGLTQFELVYGTTPPPDGTLICVPAPRDMAYVRGYGSDDTEVQTGTLIDPAHPPAALHLCAQMHVYGHRATEIAAQFNATGHAVANQPDPQKMAKMVEDLYRTAPHFPPRPAPKYIKPADAAPGRDLPPKILA